MNDFWIILETLIVEYATLHLRRFSQRSSQQTHSSCFTFSLLSVSLLCEMCPWLFYPGLGLQLIAHWGKVWILMKVGPSCRKQFLKVRSASWSPLHSASCPKWIERPLSHVPAPQCPVSPQTGISAANEWGLKPLDVCTEIAPLSLRLFMSNILSKQRQAVPK